MKGFDDFYLKAKARVWPRLSNVCRIRSIAAGVSPECKAGPTVPCGDVSETLPLADQSLSLFLSLSIFLFLSLSLGPVTSLDALLVHPGPLDYSIITLKPRVEQYESL